MQRKTVELFAVGLGVAFVLAVTLACKPRKKITADEDPSPTPTVATTTTDDDDDPPAPKATATSTATTKATATSTTRTGAGNTGRGTGGGGGGAPKPNCFSTQIVCNGRCTSIQDDPHNCGSCGYDCTMKYGTKRGLCKHAACDCSDYDKSAHGGHCED